MRMSEAEARKLGILPKAPKKSKYNSKRIRIDGICFDSQMEANYYCQLKLLQRAGVIEGFCRQARFVIIEGKNGENGVEYVTDFIVFYPNKTYRIIDVKGMKTDVFKLKSKGFREKFPKLKLELEEQYENK